MKKAIRFVVIIILSVFVLFNIYVLISGKTFLYKTLLYNYVDIDDKDLFHSREIKAGTGVEWPLSSEYNKKPMPDVLKQALEKNKSVAMLVIKNDSLLYENYWEQYNDSVQSNSFSMAKSIIGILVGIAIDEGKIKSLEQPVGDFIPEYKTGSRAQLTLRHLITMSAALSWDEAYTSMTSVTTEAYYGTNLYELVTKQEVIETPGKKFNYQSGCTELLAIVIKNSTGKSVSEYASEKLWQPLQAMHNADWSLDKKNGLEKAYCCFYSNARDFARIGALYMHYGNWKGIQVVDSNWVKESITPAPLLDEGKPNKIYGYHWWLDNYSGHSIYYCRGLLGQYIVVIPDEHIIFVRLGHIRPEKNADGSLSDLPIYVNGVLDWVK